MRRAHVIVFIAMSLVLPAPGCGGKKIPQLTEVEGVVLLDGEPLPRASVQFVPELKDFGSQYNSRAVTDNQGRFKLVCRKTGEEGAVIGWHRVLVMDFWPAELRGQSEEARLKLAEYYDNLKNRPIPQIYASVGKTPLRVEVTAEQKSYVLPLTRPKSDD